MVPSQTVSNLLKGVSLVVIFVTSLCSRLAWPQDLSHLEASFQSVSPEVRPWVYWFWLNGNLTKEGITADLEAMARVGVGGVLIMEVDQGTPPGPVRFGSPEWRELFQFMLKEARRLNIKVNMNNDAGWTGSGGPWIQPEQAMQRLVWSETTVEGPQLLKTALPQPATVADYYRDVAVLAFPRPSQPAQIPHIARKSLLVPYDGIGVVPTLLEEPPKDQVVAREQIVDLTSHMTPDGQLTWDVPAGSWTILRFGHTPTGARNHPAPSDGQGLECDKLSPEGADAMFAGLMEKLIGDSKTLVGEARTLVATHIDSWEVGSQNWTARMSEEFARRRGYELRPYLPVIVGYVVTSRELSERFLWDFRQTIGELVLDNYAGRFRELARRHGMRLTVEAYTSCPVDELAYAGRADEPMGEFWSWSRYGAAFSCTEMASAAHVYGKPVVGAEAFTATDAERWLGHPGNIKELADWAFCEGINRFVVHRYAMQPWTNPVRFPGISMGPWGLHYERTQTWWEYSRPWHEYLGRCQALLQQGSAVADVCLMTPEAVPMTLSGQKALSKSGRPRERGEHSFDFCPSEAILKGATVHDGEIVLASGMRYRVLVLPRVTRMTLPLAQKVSELIQNGATVIGGPPVKAPGLADYPEADEKLKALAEEVWGTAEAPQELTERLFGKGRIVFGGPFAPSEGRPARPGLAGAKWIWTTEGRPASAVPVGYRYFRRVFEVPQQPALKTAWLVMTVDNSFECLVNGRHVMSGEDFRRPYRANVTGLLRPGANVIAVRAFNASDAPNPAGLIAALHLEFTDGTKTVILSDKSWQWSGEPTAGWDSDPMALSGWHDSQEVGPLGVPPWGEVSDSLDDPEIIADLDEVQAIIKRLGIPPDFHYADVSEARPLRYIHKQVSGCDVYFIANKTVQPVQATCWFRVANKRVQLWRPATGAIERVVVYQEKDGGTEIPLHLEPLESVFVVFRPEPPIKERIISLEHNGQELLWPQGREGTLVIRKALYGVLGDPARTRDVTEKLRTWIAEGRRSFQVAELAREDDPALFVVKRLSVDFEIDGQPGQLEATDSDEVTFPRAAVREPLARIVSDSLGRCRLSASKPGNYTIRTSMGRTITLNLPQPWGPTVVNGPWEVTFKPGWGAPEKITLEKLLSWHEHPDPGVRYYSGVAVYSTTFPGLGRPAYPESQLEVDLGSVAVMARVKVNNVNLGAAWCEPYRVIGQMVAAPEQNSLQIEVANLWVNRMIGDELLPEDSERHPSGSLKTWPEWLLQGQPSPSGRLTFTTWRLWKKDDPLQVSGLLGPVTLREWVQAQFTLEP